MSSDSKETTTRSNQEDKVEANTFTFIVIERRTPHAGELTRSCIISPGHTKVVGGHSSAEKDYQRPIPLPDELKLL